MLKMSEVNASVSLLKSFVNGLKSKVIDYRRLLRVIETYLSNLKTKDVRKVLSTHEKVSKFLNVFLLELTDRYASTMKIGLIIKSFDTSKIEESDLYKNLSKKTYNEQVEAYNKSIVRFSLIRKKLENGELITSDDKTLEIDMFNRQFKALLGLERGEGYRLWKALSLTTGELKMIARNASLLLVTEVGKKSDSATEIRSVNLSAFDSIQPKSVLSKNRNLRTFEYICRIDEIPAIQRRDLQIFEPNDELDRHDLAKVPSESPEPDYVPYDWGSDFYDYSDDTIGTNYDSGDSIPEQHLYQSIDELLEEKSDQDLAKRPMETMESDYALADSKYDLDNSPSNKKESNSTFEDTLSELQQMYESIDRDFPKFLSKPQSLQECCLLPNSSKNPTYRTETKRFMLKNSCGFDSIAQILLANVTDYPNFENASQQNSQVIDLILKLRASSCSKAASLRDDYLVSKNIALAKSGGIAPSLVIDLFGKILGVWVKYFDELPSAYRHFTCHPENRYKKSAFEIVKVGPTRKISIEEELNGFKNDKLKCHLCRKMSETYFELQNYLFIDLTISGDNKKYTCKLNMFPEKLNLLKTKFRLAGVIAEDSEHLKAYVRRINGDWELYDNLKEKVTKCFAFNVIAPEAVVYIRE